MDNRTIWNQILYNIRRNPRDLPTRCINNKQPIYFYTYSDYDNIKVKNANVETPSASIKTERTLTFTEFEKIYPIYIKREQGKRVSKEATAVTRNQVYWFSIIYNCTKNNGEICLE